MPKSGLFLGISRLGLLWLGLQDGIEGFLEWDVDLEASVAMSCRILFLLELLYNLRNI
jgi:hypothetical protein